MTSESLPPIPGDHCEINSQQGTFVPSDISGSFMMFLLVFGASEIIVFLLCRWIGQYTNAMFYSDSLYWIHYEDSLESDGALSEELVSRSLKMDEFIAPNKADSCCPICLSNFEAGDIVVHGDCSHSFHKDCLFSWLSKQSSCPCCRQNMVPKGKCDKEPNTLAEIPDEGGEWFTNWFTYGSLTTDVEPSMFYFLF